MNLIRNDDYGVEERERIDGCMKKIFYFLSNVPDEDVISAIKMYMKGKVITDIIKGIQKTEDGFMPWLVRYEE